MLSKALSLTRHEYSALVEVETAKECEGEMERLSWERRAQHLALDNRTPQFWRRSFDIVMFVWYMDWLSCGKVKDLSNVQPQ